MTTTETGFPGLSPVDAHNPQKVSNIVSRMNRGKLNCTGTVTLAASAATTTVTDSRVGAASIIVLTALTANAAADVAAGVYISARTPGVSFVLTHPNNANVDKSFGYAVIG